MQNNYRPTLHNSTRLFMQGRYYHVIIKALVMSPRAFIDAAEAKGDIGFNSKAEIYEYDVKGKNSQEAQMRAVATHHYRHACTNRPFSVVSVIHPG